MKINIVLFWHTNDWGEFGRAYEQIAKSLAENKKIRRVSVILPPVSTDSGGYFFDHKKVARKLYIITPYWQSINKAGRFYNIRTFINRKLPVIKALKIYLRITGHRKQNTVLWIYPPHDYLYILTTHIPHHSLITHIVDNNTTRDVTEDEARRVNKIYDDISRDADIIFTSSKYNFDIFNKPDKRCYLIENGVSDDFIATPTKLPSKVAKTRPRLGYIGFITERTDINLMCHIAKKCPEFDLIVAGPDEGIISNSELLSYNNVNYLGPVSQEKVIELIQTFDVCIIPHIDSTYSQSMSPLKLYQYLASGRPIVSTPVAGTEKFSTLISLASTPDDFVKAIHDAISMDTPTLAAKRIESIKSQRWCNQVEEMVDKLSNL